MIVTPKRTLELFAEIMPELPEEILKDIQENLGEMAPDIPWDDVNEEKLRENIKFLRDVLWTAFRANLSPPDTTAFVTLMFGLRAATQP